MAMEAGDYSVSMAGENLEIWAKDKDGAYRIPLDLPSHEIRN